jgi:GNAT superfamily N-acetyltransferase
MNIEYKVGAPITTEQFVDLLMRSTLGERRPVNDRDCIEGMIANSSLMVTAWESQHLIGIARSVTDFHYACYLSDLAVCQSFQYQGIGKQLLKETQNQLGPRCKLILVAAPAANSYYEHIGFTANPRCWILQRDDNLHG